MYAAGEGVNLESYKYIPFKNPTPTYRLHGKSLDTVMLRCSIPIAERFILVKILNSD